MSTREKETIDAINTSKDAVASAISEKGVSVPVGAKLADMPELVQAIETGGGGNTKTYDTIVIGTTTSGHTLDDCDYLCDGTDDQIEIQAAIDSGESGKFKILFLQGTYKVSASVIINKSCIISANTVVPFKLYQVEPVVSIMSTYPTLTTTDNCFEIKDSPDVYNRVVIEGLTFYTIRTHAAIYILDKTRNNVTIKNCLFIIHSTSRHGIEGAVDTTKITDSIYTIKDCIFDHNGTSSVIRMHGTTDVAYGSIFFDNNIIRHSLKVGFDIRYTNLLMARCNFFNGRNSGISILYSKNINILDNVFETTTTNQTISAIYGNTLEKITVANNKTICNDTLLVGFNTGCSLYNTSFFSIRNNQFINEMLPIKGENLSNGTICDNVLKGSSQGLNISGQNNRVKIIANTICSEHYGVETNSFYRSIFEANTIELTRDTIVYSSYGAKFGNLLNSIVCNNYVYAYQYSDTQNSIHAVTSNKSIIANNITPSKAPVVSGSGNIVQNNIT